MRFPGQALWTGDRSVFLALTLYPLREWEDGARFISFIPWDVESGWAERREGKIPICADVVSDTGITVS